MDANHLFFLSLRIVFYFGYDTSMCVCLCVEQL